MSIETKRDIFRKEMLYIKKNQKLEKLKSNNGTESSGGMLKENSKFFLINNFT